MTTFYEDKRFTLLNGDCRLEMKSLADCSIDSIVTDPPYELTANKRGGTGAASLNLNSPAGRARVTTGFMGKRWDGTGAPFDVDTWIECLRVLKPGGHLLAFGGSRTYHRLACAIEDAGFEIRDQIQWIYSSGFPKSLNVSNNLRDAGFVCTCNENGEALSEHGLRSVPDTDIPPPLYAQNQQGQVLQSCVSEQGASEYWSAWSKSETSGREQSGLEGRGYGVQEEGKLHRRSICASAEMGEGNGSQGRLLDGASVSDGADVWIPTNQNGSGQPLGSQALEQCADELGVVADERGSQAWGGWPICSRCRKPILPEGIGSALKPAHEPIVVARKPLVSTLIQNVLQHGTGGLNIDGCRIETGDDLNGGTYRGSQSSVDGTSQSMSGALPNVIGKEFVAPIGRWPANVIHDGSEEVLAAFPDAPGQQGDLSGHSKDRLSKGIFGDMKSARDAVARLDSGSAARFFYCAKATQEDRNEGLEGNALSQTIFAEGTGLRNNGDGTPRNQQSTSRNPHPTVKPTDLMRYLCRLITPPGGVVLDPFCGSGSTGKAAMLEGLRFIGIEKEAEYIELAQRRIEAVTKQGVLFA